MSTEENGTLKLGIIRAIVESYVCYFDPDDLNVDYSEISIHIAGLTPA